MGLQFFTMCKKKVSRCRKNKLQNISSKTSPRYIKKVITVIITYIFSYNYINNKLGNVRYYARRLDFQHEMVFDTFNSFGVCKYSLWLTVVIFGYLKNLNKSTF